MHFSRACYIIVHMSQVTHSALMSDTIYGRYRGLSESGPGRVRHCLRPCLQPLALGGPWEECEIVEVPLVISATLCARRRLLYLRFLTVIMTATPVPLALTGLGLAIGVRKPAEPRPGLAHERRCKIIRVTCGTGGGWCC